MKRTVLSFLLIASFLFAPATYAEDTLRFIIMSSESPTVEYPKYRKLADFLKTKISSINDIKLIVAKDYRDAAERFKKGEADGMFAGSFVAAILIKKGLAVPVVRPVSINGASTYKALVIAKKGTASFKGAEDFSNKKVAYCELASSGDIFALSLLEGKNPNDIYVPVKVPRHELALQALKSGGADYAIIKNLTWDPQKYSDLVVVAGDNEENPNNTLILHNAVYKKYGSDIEKALLTLTNNNSAESLEVKNVFNISGYLKTTEKNFSHTYEIIKKAKIDPQKYNF